MSSLSCQESRKHIQIYVHNSFRDRVINAQDPKNALQEFFQRIYGNVALSKLRYAEKDCYTGFLSAVSAILPDFLGGYTITLEGHGEKKKEAEQSAALAVLDRILKISDEIVNQHFADECDCTSIADPVVDKRTSTQVAANTPSYPIGPPVDRRTSTQVAANTHPSLYERVYNVPHPLYGRRAESAVTPTALSRVALPNDGNTVQLPSCAGRRAESAVTPTMTPTALCHVALPNDENHVTVSRQYLIQFHTELQQTLRTLMCQIEVLESMDQRMYDLFMHSSDDPRI